MLLQAVNPAVVTSLRAVALAVLLSATPARAYVRTTTETSGVAVQWNERCVVVTIDQRGSKDVPLADVATTLQRAINNWTSRTAQCGGLALSMQPARAVLDVAPDGLPAVIFRNDEWRRPGHAPHDPSAIGLTTVMYVNTPGQLGDGTILDADIELNNVNYTFTTDPMTAVARPETQIADLENTLTHELGHVQGLAHTCWDHVTPTPPLDNHGNPIPDCNGDVSPDIIATTMYPYASMPGETTKRSLTDDDVHGVCDVYAPLVAHLGCYPEVDGGCSAAAAPRRSPRRWPLALVALALVAVVVAQRRRR
jgi:hypothetical protein